MDAGKVFTWRHALNLLPFFDRPKDRPGREQQVKLRRASRAMGTEVSSGMPVDVDAAGAKVVSELTAGRLSMPPINEQARFNHLRHAPRTVFDVSVEDLDLGKPRSRGSERIQILAKEFGKNSNPGQKG
eukprot:scaffold259070_cov21-Prasinocladus_malaysianus.AAC.1